MPKVKNEYETPNPQELDNYIDTAKHDSNKIAASSNMNNIYQNTITNISPSK